MKRGQSSLEYAILLVIVVGSLLAMQVYIKRGMQGKLRQVADELGQQYAPKNTISDITITSTSNVTTTVNTEEVGNKLKTTTTSTINEEQSRTGKETVGGLKSSLF